jgi:hypothetical protein
MPGSTCEPYLGNLSLFAAMHARIVMTPGGGRPKKQSSQGMSRWAHLSNNCYSTAVQRSSRGSSAAESVEYTCYGGALCVRGRSGVLIGRKRFYSLRPLKWSRTRPRGNTYT